MSVERIGHRGAPKEFRENTLSAFQRAFERGANAVELDVHATADGTVVVHHDPALESSASAYAGRAIAQLTLKDLRAVELEPGLGIPTLAEVLAIVPSAGRVYVEVKGAAIEAAVLDIIASSTCECAVHSFDHQSVGRMRALAPNVPRGILYDKPLKDLVSAMRETGARDVWPRWNLIDRATVDLVHEEGGRVIAWTVNSRRAASSLVALGVDGLCGDDVRLFATSD